MGKPSFPMQRDGGIQTVSWHEDPPTPTEIELDRRVRRLRFVKLFLLLMLGLFLYWMFGPERGLPARGA
jgi:hypothetical protein